MELYSLSVMLNNRLTTLTNTSVTLPDDFNITIYFNTFITSLY
jgi:hypothetical protein